MDEGAFQQPTPEQIAAFVAGDPIAEDEVLGIVLPQLARWAVSRYPDLPPQEVESLVYQLGAETCRPIVRYDPSKSKLTTYLINLFSKRVNDLYEREGRTKLLVELGDESRENLPNTPYNRASTPNATTITREQFFLEYVRDMNAVDREFVELMRQGEKSDDVYAEVLARHGYPVADPAREVKNRKVRIKRRMLTLAHDTGYELGDLVDD